MKTKDISPCQTKSLLVGRFYKGIYIVIFIRFFFSECPKKKTNKTNKNEYFATHFCDESDELHAAAMRGQGE